uniref:cancer/testis antigen 1-like n=1 Tax=Jaculus jaculus TaxID=51337 RepID=UPI001E1B57B5|nr:cancer/testis antigen 1-like [Jaculus jaculus]
MEQEVGASVKIQAATQVLGATDLRDPTCHERWGKGRGLTRGLISSSGRHSGAGSVRKARVDTQEPAVGTGGAAGGGGGEEGEHRGQNRPRAPEDQRSPGRSSAGEGRSDDEDDVREPRGAQDPGNEAAAGDPDEGGPVQQGGPGEGAAAAPQDAQAPLASGPSGAAVMARGNRLLEFSVTVPFRSPLEAHMARTSLISNAQLQQMMVQQEFTVDNSTLSARLTSEDPILFRISINIFHDQFFLVLRNIQNQELVADVK